MKLLIFLVFLFTGAQVFCESLMDDYGIQMRLFSAEVYEQAAKEQTGNFLICPISVQLVMALAGNAARGQTSEQIHRGLRLPEETSSRLEIFRQLSPRLKGTDKYALNSANRIFVKQGLRVNATYRDVAEKVFDAGIESVDFSRNVETAQLINSYVEKKTNNKIHDLVDQDDFNANTKMVLINALHFKGNWKKPFDVYDTVPRNFYTSDGLTKSVEMMQITDVFVYYEDEKLDCKFLELPYEGGDLSMVFALPNKKDGLPELERRVKQAFRVLPFVKQRIRVQIPKFSMETTVQFKPILEKLGIRSVFTPEADLSGLSEERDRLYVDKVVQKTFINVTEKGTEAAAATSGGVVTLSIPAPDKYVKLEFIADHPFLVLLQNTNKPRPRHFPVILFAGRYSGPTTSPQYKPTRRFY